MATKSRVPPLVLIPLAFVAALFLHQAGAEPAPSAGAGKSVLIVYHGGQPPWRTMPPLDQDEVDALTQATTEGVNVDVLARQIRDQLTAGGLRVDLRKATEVQGPKEFLDYDGIIFGTPTWFSNVAYPLKKVFDEHLIRIYEHRPGRLNDKVLAGFVTVMESGKSGPRCLQSLDWALEHLSNRRPEGLVVNVSDDQESVNTRAAQFCKRFTQALEH